MTEEVDVLLRIDEFRRIKVLPYDARMEGAAHGLGAGSDPEADSEVDEQVNRFIGRT